MSAIKFEVIKNAERFILTVDIPKKDSPLFLSNHASRGTANLALDKAVEATHEFLKGLK